MNEEIIHTVPGIEQEAAGPSYSVVRLCEALTAGGQNLTLAAIDWGAPSTSLPFLKTFPPSLGPARLGRSSAMKNWLSRVTSSGAVRLLHNHSLWMMPNIYPGQLAQQYRLPLVVSPRGTLSDWAMNSGSVVKRFFWPLVQRPSLAATTCFHATAESEYEDIRRLGFKQPVAVIPNGIDIKNLKPRSVTNKRTLLFLGRIHPVKGLDILLPAWRAVQSKFPEWNLKIIGPDNEGYLQKVKLLAHRLELERVEFCGPYYGQDKWDAYRNADLFILPTYSENFGMAVAEALASATPAIVTKGAPWVGLCTENAGWWIDIGVEPLVACLEEALTKSPEVLLIMGEAGRKWMQRDYSWESIASDMQDVYRWILNGGEMPSTIRTQ